MPTNHVEEMSEDDWQTLLERIEEGRCTPFLGAGATSGILPTGSQIAEDWAREIHYPLANPYDLEKVAQFMAVQRQDAMVPKEKMLRLLHARVNGIPAAELEAFLSAPENTLGTLADLPLPVYMTTNYDDLLVRALAKRGKTPSRELCRWNELLRKRPSVFDKTPPYKPDPKNPLVFHLHGHDGVPESLILTEDDYLDFLVSVSRSQSELLPPRVQEAMTGASLLFLGYRLADLSFRVIFRGLVGALEGSLRRISVSVQLLPDARSGEGDAVRQYLSRYFMQFKVKVFWGTAETFLAELRRRWSPPGGGS